MNVIAHLTKALREAAVYNPDVEIAPACILWPDRDRQWESVIPRLQAELPELLVLGTYAPERRTGPAIWLRCIIAGTLDDLSLPTEHAPIIYLPGVGRQDLRAVENCLEPLKPLAELQYRGTIWSQLNARDWTILAYLKSDQGGLGLDTAQDNDARNAMRLALYRLLDEDVELLRGKRLDKDYFNTLLTGGDPVRDLLQWLDREETFREGRGENEWNAFIEVCKSQFAFDPREGMLVGAARLAAHDGPWGTVWDRFCEAPKRYPSIPARIRQCSLPPLGLFADRRTVEGWPQWNEEQEKELRHELLSLDDLPTHKAREQLRELEQRHGSRRELVWAELDEAPLAQALEHLALLAEVTTTPLAAGTIDELAETYSTYGWKADNAVLRALSYARGSGEFEAISTAVRAIYLPWAEESARYLQMMVDGASYPGGTCRSTTSTPHSKGECILFVDGLRFDTGKRLVEMLKSTGFEVGEEPIWGALPSVTATGKAAVAPVRNKIEGKEGNIDFEPAVAETGQSLRGGYHLKRLLAADGWTILEHSDSGDGSGNAWCEFGDIDHEGHSRGWKLARQLDTLLAEIRDRIASLVAAGWAHVHVVTDHGWLLLPGGLPKIELPSTLTEHKWGRCASLRPGASTEERLFPWYWNPNQQFALADGISCFRKGEEYAHGGLSLQECLTLRLTVSPGVSARSPVSIKITDVDWKGLRCTVAVAGNVSGLLLDIRTYAGDASSSLVVSVKSLKNNGTASVVVENEDLEGREATLVLFNANNRLVAQVITVIGGEQR